jgi:predicted nucleotidyltransferase
MSPNLIHRMTPEDARVLELFAERVRHVFPEARVWAFGSRARGEATSESDFDICVVLERLTPAMRRRISEIAWEIGFERDTFITTVAFAREMFEQGPMSVSPLVQSIREEGVAA